MDCKKDKNRQSIINLFGLKDLKEFERSKDCDKCHNGCKGNSFCDVCVPKGTEWSQYLYWNTDSNSWSLGGGTTDSQRIHLGINAGRLSQGLDSIAIGNSAGLSNQGSNSILIGAYANSTFPNTIVLNASGSNYPIVDVSNAFYVKPVREASNTSKILYFHTNDNEITFGDISGGTPNLPEGLCGAVLLSEGGSSIKWGYSIGCGAGCNNQKTEAIAYGCNAGFTNQGTYSIAIGYEAGKTDQSSNAIAIGGGSGFQNQGFNSIAIGYQAGFQDQSANAIAIGYQSGYQAQKSSAIAIGFASGQNNQQQDSVAIGYGAGSSNQSFRCIAIGRLAGLTNQLSDAIAIGTSAGRFNQDCNSIAIGANAGFSGEKFGAIGIGSGAGFNNQGTNAIAIGFGAGNSNQGTNSIAIGSNAGLNNQGTNAIAIGNSAGVTAQKSNGVAIGNNSGFNNQGTDSIAIGNSAGNIRQGSNSIAFGLNAGGFDQSNNAIAIGTLAGQNNQGANSIAIGNNAGSTNQSPNSIVLNASGTGINPSTQSLYVAPIRELSGTNILYYNTTSKEITYSIPQNPFSISSYFPLGVFYSTETQTTLGQNLTLDLSYNNTDISNGVYLSGSPNTRIYVSQSGTYRIFATLQADSVQNDTKLNYWLKRNGSNVANTSSFIVVKNSREEIIAPIEWVISLNGGDYVQVAFMSLNRAGGEIITIPGSNTGSFAPPNDYPASPSIIISVQRIN